MMEKDALTVADALREARERGVPLEVVVTEFADALER